MADELAQVETTTIEETQEQTPEVVEESAESEESIEPTGKGDLNEALRQEREKRQELERRLSDPAFVYQQARTLGLTEEEAEAQAQAQSVQAPTPDAYGQYTYFRELEKAQEKYPQLSKDSDDQVAITALMNANGLSPLAAADRYYAKITKVAAEARTEGMKQKETVISEKEQAQTVTSTASTSSEAAEYEALIARTRNQTNPKDAERAHLELIMWKEKHRT